ncbi:MAG: asparagine synthetase B, partial [Patescibacteria group bacterium]|nr:asparagine synthetase B [Patescibacteria group bacterium]
MCGICGIFSQEAINFEVLEKMNLSLQHRGPDETGNFFNGKVGLASRRLAIIDLKTGRQPLHNEEKKLWLVFNGEIYNFKALKERLLKKGHCFYTQTDGECLLHLFEEEGEAGLKKLEGMFAFALYDEKRQNLILVRDPLGEKPLFWTLFDKKLYFASEIKSLLQIPGFKKKIEKKSLGKYLFYGFVPGPKTIYQGIN